MQLLLESTSARPIIATPNLVDPSMRSYMDSCVKTLIVHGMASTIVPQFLSQGIWAQQLWNSF